MAKPVIGLIFGIIAGSFFPLDIMGAYTKLFSVVLLVALDSVFGGLRASVNKNFSDMVFISGFLTNALFAAFLVFVGDRLGIDLYYGALLVFGFRIFKNLAGLRRHLLKNF
ncbi:MAG: small basic family protein [Selenomonadaceae bacterium]|nr:small basic family protein [Selenomonadaceae bacterium]